MAAILKRMGNIESVGPVPCHVKEQNFSSGPQGSQLTDDKIEGNFSSSLREAHFEANGNNSNTSGRGRDGTSCQYEISQCAYATTTTAAKVHSH